MPHRRYAHLHYRKSPRPGARGTGALLMEKPASPDRPTAPPPTCCPVLLTRSLGPPAAHMLPDLTKPLRAPAVRPLRDVFYLSTRWDTRRAATLTSLDHPPQGPPRPNAAATICRLIHQEKAASALFLETTEDGRASTEQRGHQTPAMRRQLHTGCHWKHGRDFAVDRETQGPSIMEKRHVAMEVLMPLSARAIVLRIGNRFSNGADGRHTIRYRRRGVGDHDQSRCRSHHGVRRVAINRGGSRDGLVIRSVPSWYIGDELHGSGSAGARSSRSEGRPT
jgi:hypothetical protein